MKGNSDTYPAQFQKRNSKTQFCFNVVPVEKQDMDGATRKSYDYDYIVFEGDSNRDKLIDAVIADRYSKSAELAMINNEMATPGMTEYVEYQAYRAEAKRIVGDALI